MSQKKIDNRRLTKGDMIHAAKQKFKMTTIIIAVVLVAIGVIVSITTYNNGKTEGRRNGYNEGFSACYDRYFETKADESKADESKADESKEDESKADESKAESEAQTESAAK